MVTARTRDRGVSTSDQEQLSLNTNTNLNYRSKSLHRKEALIESGYEATKLEHTAEDSSLFDIDEESAANKSKNFDQKSS
jgi:hypothetical protein